MKKGARDISLTELLAAVSGRTDTVGEAAVVARIPRTVLAVLVGAALALAGATMQAMTRNPLADPGLFGINAGASVAVLTAVTVFGITGASGFVWFAFLGAAVAAVASSPPSARSTCSATGRWGA